jgi:hypothetical protein
MSAPSSEQDEPVAIPVPVPVEQEKITAKRWQISVRSIILLIAVIAVWKAQPDDATAGSPAQG